MSGFEVSTEQVLLQFGTKLAAMNVRSFAPPAPRGRVVCFHGFVGDARDYDPLCAYLASEGVATIAPDIYGRGESAHFDTAEQYTLRRLLHAAAAVLEQHGRGAVVLGHGWGALIALLAMRMAQIVPKAFVAIGLPLDYSTDDDPVIQRALEDRERLFATEDAALTHLLGSPEFNGGTADVTPRHRVRQTEAGFRMRHDDRVTQRTRNFSGKQYDLRQMLDGLGAPAVLLGEDEEAPLAGVTRIDGMAFAGLPHRVTPAARLLILGLAVAQQRFDGPAPRPEWQAKAST